MPFVCRARASSALATVLLVAGVLVTPRGTQAQAETVATTHRLIVGERLEYEVKFGPIKVGRASMEVMGVE